MNDWDTIELGEIVKSGGGKIHTGPFGSQLHASDYVASGIPCIMPANIVGSCVDLSKIAYITEVNAQRLSKYIVDNGDIVYSRRGDVTLKALIREHEAGYFCGTGCLLIRPGSEVDSEFLTYYLSTTAMKKWIKKQAIGATMPNLNTGILARIPFKAPDKIKQIKLSKIISLINKKIELNNKINAELEAMAKLIYDYWFVQFDFPDAKGKPYKSSGGKMVYNEELKREIPDGWDAGNIMQLTNLLGGGTPKTTNEKFWNGSIPFFTPADAEANIFSLKTKESITPDGLDSCSSRLFSKGTIFITARGTVGKINIASTDMAMNQSCYALQGKEGVNFEFVFFYVDELVHYIKSKASGSIFKALVTNDFKFTPMTIPPIELIKKFTKVIESSFEKILLNKTENKNLTELRDWLLPMLMNGQVTVKNT